ncbi:hypothetical protein [Inhella crocodyli]|uniref:Uncharacterized protein n=1 Tax=Inhella crocodyli TaxID=2499851 RepID=A0A437LEK0_9BURK|nr:hypothetical protein [Inhella crocodyli]RVT83778.1 hypothetical protein EOD73_14525 [Inhella crocodyli]
MASEGRDPDPLWRNSPVKLGLLHAAFYALYMALGALAVGGITRSWLGAAIGAAVMGLLVLTAGLSVVDGLFAPFEWLRRGSLARLEGRHYSFAGQALDIHDDGRECWIAEHSIRKALGHARDDAFKARFANQWREARELGLPGKALWVRVSALHQHLADAPERMDPRRVRLRTYLDRDVMQPAARRRDRV